MNTLRLILLAALQSGCATLHPSLTSMALVDSTIIATTPEELPGQLVPSRWYIWRALEKENAGRYTDAQGELDAAHHLLSWANEAADWVTTESVDNLRREIEVAYLRLLPNLKTFSPDSPLSLLLRGLSEEKLEELPADAAPMVRIHQLRSLCDVPIDANARVTASIHFFQSRGRDTFMAWLQRSGRYRELIEEILEEEGLPLDLLYVAMIESGFNPRAYSRARAVGLWQFIEQTGKLEGLRRTHWVDERRDPIRSTRAAARHLKSLYVHFGDWRLALAAYNAGRGRVSRAIEHDSTRNFWELNLPRETQNYVPLFMAAVVMAKDPALFGFPSFEPEPSLRFETFQLKRAVRLEQVAKCLDINLAELRRLNPELRQGVSPPHPTNPYDLYLPPGGPSLLHHCMGTWLVEDLSWQHYIVQANDSVWSIARAFGISSDLIIEANSLANADHIYIGQKLYIPMVLGVPGSVADAVVHPHSIQPGDSLSRIARLYGVTIQDLKVWNNLPGTTIRAGEMLTVWRIPQLTRQLALSPEAPIQRSEQASIPIIADLYHEVRSGDTLWDIARLFDVAVLDLRRWNELDGTIIHPGQRLRVVAMLPEETNYKVAPGDTLYGIARKFGLTTVDLARINNISPSSTLLAGSSLRVKPMHVAD